jgi:hypothetical protein
MEENKMKKLAMKLGQQKLFLGAIIPFGVIFYFLKFFGIDSLIVKSFQFIGVYIQITFLVLLLINIIRNYK